jgi:ABC-type branched-subunit amino acid transport system ATPase component/ABC-type branched-subunit amino acid transport system permease subunit
MTRAPARVVAALAVGAALAGSLLAGDVRLSIFVGVAATAIAALGLDVLVARTGQLSLAHGAFLGIGAFTAINAGDRGAPWPLAVLAGVVVTTVAAVVAGLPSLRIRGLQIAITTLAFQVFAEKYLFTRDDVTAQGRTLDRPSFLRGDVQLYLFALVCLVLVLVARHRLAVTKGGRAFQAVRDVEGRAQCFGVQPGPNKLLAYAISGAIVGLAGAVVAMKAGSISARDPFLLLESLQLVAIVVVGGAGSAPGIVTAAVLFKAVPQIVTEIPLVHLRADRVVPIGSAALLVVAVVAQPEGIGGVYRSIGRVIDRLAARGRDAERPDPRPRLVDVDTVARQATTLRSVTREFRLGMPVRALLEARNVRVAFGGVVAIDGVSLEVRRGEIIGLIGANGAGKSTFFNAVSGLAPVTGSIRYRGIELVGASPARRSALGIARTFQDMGLVRAETVTENVLLAQAWLATAPAAASILGLGTSIADERRLRRRAGLALELFGLEHLAGARLGELPYGTMRIVEIAAAVAAGPDLLLLDEATAGLGPEESHALGDRFVALRDELGLTLVVIEHHVPLVARVCDYVYCLESGMLIAEGSPADVTAQPRVVESFLGGSAAATGGAAR